jgi:hypothetical protein
MMLLHGHDFFHELRHQPTRDDLLAAWSDLRAKLVDEMGSQRRFAGCRPWGWWQFESPVPRDPDRPEADQLRDLGLLTEDEEHVLWMQAESRKPAYE